MRLLPNKRRVTFGLAILLGILSGWIQAAEPTVWVRLGSVVTPTTLNNSTPDPEKIPWPFPKKIRQRQGGKEVLVEVPVETYVAQVLAGESLKDFPLEALKAQAVAIRSLAMRPQKPHRKEAFDFCDSTHCQVFSYHATLPPAVQSAVAQTRGLVLMRNQQVIEALYHSTCGGHTSDNAHVFGGEPLPYLAGVDDEAFCRDSPHTQWNSRIPLREMREIFPEIPDLEKIRILESDRGGRNFMMELSGAQRIRIPTQDFLLRVGRHLGWSLLKSANFQVRRQGENFIFEGRGLGHGVGMCQWGARGMARQGFNFREILRHYYPGTQLQRIASF